MCRQMQFLQMVKEKQTSYDNIFEPLQDIIDVLTTYNVEIPEKSMEQLQELPERWLDNMSLSLFWHPWRSFRNCFIPFCRSQLLATERFRESVWKCIFSRKKMPASITFSHHINQTNQTKNFMYILHEIENKKIFFFHIAKHYHYQEPFKKPIH